MLELRLLDPASDIDLFRESYNWRPKQKRHTQPDRMAFETFIATDPRQIVIGVFNGEMLAAFLLYEIEPGIYDCHFTSKRGAPKELLIEGGKMIRNTFFENGARELTAQITERNSALKSYLHALGFNCVKSTCPGGANHVNSALSGRSFVKYRICAGDLPSE